jgi:HEPN domain-containing protein
MDEALAQLTGEWLTKALHDLQTARITAHAPGGPLDTAIYHCQQAAEKSLKGWLTANGIPFEKTHDLRRLVKQAAAVWPDFNPFTDAAEVLTPYVSAFRYPGLTSEPDADPRRIRRGLATRPSHLRFRFEPAAAASAPVKGSAMALSKLYGASIKRQNRCDPVVGRFVVLNVAPMAVTGLPRVIQLLKLKSEVYCN